MGKLRRSRFAKFISGFLILVLSVSIVANVAGAFILYQENLFYASRIQLQQKVYSHLYNFTASDLMSYLRLMENAYCNNDIYSNYHDSEIDLYESKYSSDKSNINFYITDENGNILLANKNKLSDEIYRFSSVYSTDTEYYDWYKLGNTSDDGINESVIAVPTTFSDSSENSDAIDINESDETTTVKTEPVQSISDKYNVDKSSVQNTYTGNNTEINYYYTGSVDSYIFEHCRSFAKNLTYDISSITFYQDEFYYYDDEGIANNYSDDDSNSPERIITFTLYSDNKEADIIYRYNGTLSFSEFTSRLSYSALIMQNSEAEQLSLEYRQNSRLQIRVTVEVPYYCTANDIYKYAESFVILAESYKDNIITISVIELLLFILCFVFIFYSAGYIPDKEKPVARGLHAIPTDILYLIGAVGLVICFIMMSNFDMLFFIAGAILAALIILTVIYISVVKLRTNTFRKNTLIGTVYYLAKSAARTLNENTGSKIKIFLIICLLIFIAIIEAFCVILFDMNSTFVAGAIILIRILEIPVITILLIALTALHKGAKQISSGDISYRITNPLLFGILKQYADNLNNINDAVNTAVEQRLKSENMKTELITNVSHDLKTPLTSIVNYVDLLKKEQIDNAKAVEYIKVIDRQAERLKKLTVDIVEASKAATGNIDVKLEPTALNVILLQTSGEYMERLEELNLSIVQDIPDKDIIISTDGRLLWRVIENLMNNICKYSMPGTRVYISLTESETETNISFRNISRNKLNISPEELTERFVRGDQSRNTEGSGLGLSIANSLTGIIGGKLTLSIDGDLFKATITFPKNTKI